MIDFHSHILPYMDDGAKNVTQSLEMLNELRKQSVDTVVLTSHFYPLTDSPQNFLERQSQAFALLNEELSADCPKMILGSEVQYFEGISLCESIKPLRINNTSYMLLEMPFKKWNDRFLDEVVTMHRCGTNIIFAHIERYLSYISPGMLEELINEGIIIQSNSDFFTSLFTRKKALNMLLNGKIHLIGSDCHNMTDRAPKIGEAYEIISKKLGKLFIEEIDKLGSKILFSE